MKAPVSALCTLTCMLLLCGCSALDSQERIAWDFSEGGIYVAQDVNSIKSLPHGPGARPPLQGLRFLKNGTHLLSLQSSIYNTALSSIRIPPARVPCIRSLFLR